MINTTMIVNLVWLFVYILTVKYYDTYYEKIDIAKTLKENARIFNGAVKNTYESWLMAIELRRQQNKPISMNEFEKYITELLKDMGEVENESKSFNKNII